MSSRSKCEHCGGSTLLRNPLGYCDHLNWPENLTDEAKQANGYKKVRREIWVLEESDMKKPIPVKGLKLSKSGKLEQVQSFDASKQRRIASSKKVRVGRPKP